MRGQSVIIICQNDPRMDRETTNVRTQQTDPLDLIRHLSPEQVQALRAREAANHVMEGPTRVYPKLPQRMSSDVSASITSYYVVRDENWGSTVFGRASLT